MPEAAKLNIITTCYDKTTDYGYDLADMLSEVKISTPEADGQGGVTYRNDGEINGYNASGQRVTRLDGQWTDTDSDGVVDPEELSDTTTTNFYYTGGATLYTTNSNNYLTTENVLDLGGSIIASARFDEYEGYYFYNYDMRGSTTAILQPDGSLITGYEYDEFGNLERSGDAEFLNDVTFTGSVSDTSTGLQYMNSRYYNPSTGRFLSQDTYSGNPYDPWTQHLYAYCGNNPVNMVDPTGHRPIRNGGNPYDEIWTKEKGEWKYKGSRAKPPQDEKSLEKYNCAGYAAGRKDWGNFNIEDMNTQAATDAFIEWVGKDAKGNNYARQLDSIDDKLADDEYLVIVDSGKDKKVSSQFYGFESVISDYHFVVKSPRTGRYSHKPGEGNIRPMGESEVLKDWDLGISEGNKELINGWKGFYDDGKKFVAVKLEVREFGFKEFY